MNKFGKLQAFVDERMTSQFIADQITDAISDILEGVHGREADVSTVWIIGDLLDTEGFYTVPDIVRELISCFMGRLFRIACIDKFNINITTPSSIRKVLPILASTEEREAAAVPLAIEQLKVKFGVPANVNYDKVRELISMRDAKLNRVYG